MHQVKLKGMIVVIRHLLKPQVFRNCRTWPRGVGSTCGGASIVARWLLEFVSLLQRVSFVASQRRRCGDREPLRLHGLRCCDRLRRRRKVLDVPTTAAAPLEDEGDVDRGLDSADVAPEPPCRRPPFLDAPRSLHRVLPVVGAEPVPDLRDRQSHARSTIFAILRSMAGVRWT